MIITGSKALAQYSFFAREPADIDYIATENEYSNFINFNSDKIVTTVSTKFGYTVHMLGSKPIEFDIARNNNSTEQFIKIYSKLYYYYYYNNNINYLNPEEVYTFKMTHRYLKNSPHFKKTMDDILLLREYGYGNIPHSLKDWVKVREKETYDYKHPKLKKTAAYDFFDTATGVIYEYNHDSIHESIKHLSCPAYELIKENKTDVFCSKERFYQQPIEIQLLTVLEESYTLALERSQIPNNFKTDPKVSFLKALEKVCTSISSGWWREFAWENYYQVLELYNENYVEKFHDGLKNGIVKPYEGK